MKNLVKKTLVGRHIPNIPARLIKIKSICNMSGTADISAEDDDMP